MRDVNLYLHFSEMVKRFPIKQESDVNGYSPIECFVKFDSTGKIPPCNDLDTLDKIFKGKENVNLQITLWSSGVVEGCSTLNEIKECCQEYPEWVYTSVVNQVERHFRKTIGFIPKFIYGS